MIETPIYLGRLQSDLNLNGFNAGEASSGGAGFNIKAYGAKGDGVTDDTTAMQDALAAIPATGGSLYCPAGTYKYTGPTLVLDKPVTVQGDGGGVHFVNLGPIVGVTGQPAISNIDFYSTTGTLFDVQKAGCTFYDIALRNKSGTTPTAGAGIVVSADGDRTRYENLSVDGFYINIDVQAGSAHTFEGCWICAPVLYGMKFRNVAVPDGGDHAISNCAIYAGAAATAAAAIRIESGGGIKIINTKINAMSASEFLNGIDLAVASGIVTVDLLISNCSIEGVQFAGIKGTTQGQWASILLTGNQIFPANTGSPYGIYFDGTGGAFNGLNLTGNWGIVNSSSNPFLNPANVTSVVISGNGHSGFSDLLNTGSGVTYARSAGVPAGGTAGQVLKKLSSANYDVGWV